MSLLPKTQTINCADYLFLMPTLHFGTVGVAVANGGRWAGIGRMEDGSGQGLVTLLGEKQTKRQYVTASPDRTIDFGFSPDSLLAALVERTYSSCAEAAERRRHPVWEQILSQFPFHNVLREMQKTHGVMELQDLAALLVEHGIEQGVVEPNYMNRGMIK